MNITEKDLYKFVFYKSELSLEKQSFISENLDKFSSSLELLHEIKSQSEMEISPTIITRIHELIESQSVKEEIVLTPVIVDECSDYLILAADSETTTSDNCSQTFADPGNNYLIKVINEENKSKLFLFSKNKEANLNLSLTVYPANEKYILDNNSPSFVLLKKQKVDKIIIRR